MKEPSSMDVSEIRDKKFLLEKSISEQLHQFEDETGLPVSSIEFVRRECTNEFGMVVSICYAVELKVEI